MPPREFEEDQPPTTELQEAQNRLAEVEDRIEQIRQDLCNALHLAEIEDQTPSQYYEWRRLTTAQLATLQQNQLQKCLLTKHVRDLTE